MSDVMLAGMSDVQITQSLAHYEAIIERGLKTFVEVGNALLAIRDSRLYCKDYATFEDYCQKRWGMDRTYAHRTIDAAKVMRNLLSMGNISAPMTLSNSQYTITVKPVNERQVRPLTRLESPEQQREAWQRAVETAPNGKPTGEHVKRIVLEMTREPEPEVMVLPAIKSPRLIVSFAEDMPQVGSESVDLIITSPPYNLGGDSWPMGGSGRTVRNDGIGYMDDVTEEAYQEWQIECLLEMYRVAKVGASLFYNHKVRSVAGGIIHPLDWLRGERNPWTIRQEIIWDRGSTHNHSASLFWPEDERIYWMTKGLPALPSRPVGMSTVWRFHGPVAGTWHPAPFDEELPRRCIKAVGRDGITVLDPFAGRCTTLKVALEYGYDAIGVDLSAEYLERARRDNGWTSG